jgi:hypothetical protein
MKKLSHRLVECEGLSSTSIVNQTQPNQNKTKEKKGGIVGKTIHTNIKLTNKKKTSSKDNVR